MSKKEEIICLDDCVLNALDLFSVENLPSLDISFRRPFVVGSGNALVTGKILFDDVDSVFASESNYKEKIRISDFDGAVLISASGNKHAPIIARDLKERGIRTLLLTNNPLGQAVGIVDKFIIFPKNSEPYTYNTSTYMGMIFAKTKENPKLIKDELLKLDKKIPRNLRKYDSFFIIVPERFVYIRELLLTKFDELFGSKVCGRAFTYEETKHSKTIVPNEKELFISLGVENKIFGRNRFNVCIPSEFGYAGLMAFGYYIIGKIQKQKPPYFKKNISKYVKFTSKVFGEKIETIVK